MACSQPGQSPRWARISTYVDFDRNGEDDPDDDDDDEDEDDDPDDPDDNDDDDDGAQNNYRRKLD